MENAFLPRLAWDTSQLLRKSLTSLRALTLLLVMCLSIGNVWGATWQLVSNVANVEEGTYLLLTATYKPWTGSVSSGHLSASSTALSFTDGETSSIPNDAQEITLVSTGTANQYYIKKGTDYLYLTKVGSGGFKVGSTSEKWTFSGTDGLNAIGTNYAAYIRGYNGTSFRSYTSTSNGIVTATISGVETPVTEGITWVTDPSCLFLNLVDSF